MVWRTVRISAPVLGVALLTGCQSPPPSFDILGPYNATQVAPPGTNSYGRTAPSVSQRPPANDYYSRPSAAVASPSSSAVATAGASPVGDWRAATSSDLSSSRTAAATTSGQPAQAAGQVIPASAISPIASANTSTTRSDSGGIGSSGVGSSSKDSSGRDSSGKEVVRIVEPSSSALESSPRSTASFTGGGMPVNDATRPAEPRLFSPPPGVIEISQWPAAAVSAAPSPIAGDAVNPARQLRGLSAPYGVAQVSAETPLAANAGTITAGATTAGGTTGAATSGATSSSNASSSNSSSTTTLGWKAKEGLR